MSFRATHTSPYSPTPHRNRTLPALQGDVAPSAGSMLQRALFRPPIPLVPLMLTLALLLPLAAPLSAASHAEFLESTTLAVVDCPPEQSAVNARGGIQQSRIAPAAVLRWSVAGLPAIGEMTGAITEALHANAITFPGHRGTVSAFQPGPIYPEVYARDMASVHLIAPYLYPDAFLRASTEEYLFRQWTGAKQPLVPGQPQFPSTNALDGIVTNTGTTDKSTSTSDEEPSIVHSAARYALTVGGAPWLQCSINGRTVLDRLDAGLLHLVTARRDTATGLIVRAHTTDWGDVRALPTGKPTHHDPANERWTASVYDQAVIYQAMREMAALHRLGGTAAAASAWDARAAELRDRTNRFLWQAERGFYRTHLHMTSYRHAFDEDAMVSIGNAVAVASGIASAEQAARIFTALEIARAAAAVKKPGLSIYPPYPWRVWEHSLMGEWSYQNGGQWDWWGAVQIYAEFLNGHSELALSHLNAVAEEWQTHPNNILEWQHPFGGPYHGSEYYAAAGGTMGRAVVQGLFGVNLAIDGFTVRTRLGGREGSVQLQQPATNSSVHLRQQVRDDTVTVDYTVQHAAAGTLAVLLPKGKTALNVMVDGVPSPFRIERIGDEVYADAVAAPRGTHKVTIPLRPDELPPVEARIAVERVPAVMLAGSKAQVLTAVEGAVARGPAGQLRARWLAADGTERSDLANLATVAPPTPPAGPAGTGLPAPQATMVTTPTVAGDYRLRWEYLDPRAGVLPRLLRETFVRIAAQPLRAGWLGTVLDGVVLAGSQFEIPAGVENIGAETWRAQGTTPVQAALRWTTMDGTPVGSVAQSPLLRDVAPGESVRLLARVTAPAEPGRYRLTWDLVKSDAPFSRTGSPALDTYVTVVTR